MIRAIIWACAGFFICLAMDCPLTLAFGVTVVTTVIGCLDFHPGEYAIAAAALVSLGLFFHRLSLSPLSIAILMTPVLAMAGLLAWFLITNPSRSREYRKLYAAGLRPARKPASTSLEAAGSSGPARMVVEHHHYHHVDEPQVPQLPPVPELPELPELPVRGNVLPFRPRIVSDTMDRKSMS